MGSIQFDEGSADALKTDLAKSIGEISSSMDKMGREVAGIKSWWKGGSEDGFIDNFNKTKADIQKALNQCAEEYRQLVEKIKGIKRESEMNIKRQLKG